MQYDRNRLNQTEPNNNLWSDLLEQVLQVNIPCRTDKVSQNDIQWPYTAIHSRTILLLKPSCFIMPCDSGVVSCILPKTPETVIFTGPRWPCRRFNFFMICSLKEPLQPARTRPNMGYCAQSSAMIYKENGTWWWTEGSENKEFECCRTFWQSVLSSKKAQSWAEQSVLRMTRKDADNYLKRALKRVSALLKSTKAFQNCSSFFINQIHKIYSASPGRRSNHVGYVSSKSFQCELSSGNS